MEAETLKEYEYQNSLGMSYKIEAKSDAEAIAKALLFRKQDFVKGKAALWTDAPRKIRSWR